MERQGGRGRVRPVTRRSGHQVGPDRLAAAPSAWAQAQVHLATRHHRRAPAPCTRLPRPRRRRSLHSLAGRSRRLRLRRCRFRLLLLRLLLRLLLLRLLLDGNSADRVPRWASRAPRDRVQAERTAASSSAWLGARGVARIAGRRRSRAAGDTTCPARAAPSLIGQTACAAVEADRWAPKQRGAHAHAAGWPRQARAHAGRLWVVPHAGAPRRTATAPRHLVGAAEGRGGAAADG